MATMAHPPHTPSSIAARRGREAPPPPLIKTSFDDSLLQVSTPALPSATSPGRPPKIAASPRLPPPPPAQRPVQQQTAQRPALRPAKSFTNAKPSHKHSLFDLFSRSKPSDNSRLNPDRGHALPRKSLGSRPKPAALDDKTPLPLQPEPVPQEQQEMPPPTVSRTRTRLPRDSGLQESRVNKGLSGGGMDFASALKDLEPPPVPVAQPLLTAWMPPPLSQVHPQAMAHAALEDPDVYRHSRSKRRGTATSHATSRPSTGYKKPPSSTHRRPSDAGDASLEDEAADDGVPRKIYALVTAGYVLEYAGSGPRDRLPERTLKLGASSAAFASDAIPGKHWVLQIVQSADDDSSDQGLAPKKSIVKRIFNSTSTPRRKPTRSMLLVFDNPASLNNWIVAVRAEVSKFSGHAPRPPTAIKKSDSLDETEGQPAVTVTSPTGNDLAAKPASPVKHDNAPPMPSPPTLPNSPATLVGSERLSGAETAVGSGSNMSSSRSSRAIGSAKSAVDLQRVMASAISEQLPPEQTQEEAESPTRTDEERELESATTHSHASLSFDSSAGASHYSPDKATPLDESTPASSLGSPAQNFYTPLSTPVSWTFPRDQKKMSTYTSASVESKGHTSPAEQPSTAPVASPRSGPQPLRPSQSAPRLANATSPAMETIRESASHYFSRRSPAPLPEEEEPPRSPLGNAFAQAAERREKNHSRQLSNSTPSSSNNVSTRTSLTPARSSPRSTPHGSLPGSKRTSIIHSNAPLPLRTSQTYDSLSAKASGDSNGNVQNFAADLRNIRTRGESDTRESVLLQLSGESPLRPEGSPGGSSTLHQPRLRRPSSLRVKTDVAPYVATARAVQAAAATTTTPQSSTIHSATDDPRSASSSGRSSTLVPVVRPPSVRPHGPRRRAGSSSAKGPPSAPPTVPLPPPPVQMPASATSL